MIEYLELRYPLGQRRMMTMAEYAALPSSEVRGTHAPGGRDEEAALHQRFADTRVCYEWFRDTPELRAVIGQALAWDHEQARPVAGWPA